MRIWGMRPGVTIALSAFDRRRLEAIVGNRNAPQKHAWRAENRSTRTHGGLLEWLRAVVVPSAQMHETADADAVHALLVFLNLLEGDAARLAERTLAHTGALAKRSGGAGRRPDRL